MKTIHTTILAAALAVTSGAASATTLFSDDFNRANSSTVGNGWTELEADNNDVRVRNNELRLRDFLPGNPDAAAASLLIDATGFENITLSFDWRAFNANETDDDLFVALNFVQPLDIQAQQDWTQVLALNPAGGASGSETLTLSPTADNQMFNLIFWSDVGNDDEGFRIDNVVVTGDLAPVPLPAGAILLGSGLVMAAGLRRRKNKSKA